MRSRGRDRRVMMHFTPASGYLSMRDVTWVATCTFVRYLCRQLVNESSYFFIAYSFEHMCARTQSHAF